MADSTRITFVDAIADGFRNWRTIRGTATRPQFWYWFLFTVLVNLVLVTADAVFLTSSIPGTDEFDFETMTGEDFRRILDGAVTDTIWSFATLGSLLLFVPTLTVTIRRFRDAGVSPILGAVVYSSNVVVSVVLVVLSYQLSYLAGAELTNDQQFTLLVTVLGMLALAASTVTAFVVWLVIGAKPAKGSDRGNRYLSD